MPNIEAVQAYVETLRAAVPGREDRPIELWRWSARADNHEPVAREELGGILVRTDNAQGDTPVIVVWRSDFGPDGSSRQHIERDVFLVDDGRTVTPHYVSGWSPESGPLGVVYAQPFPLDFHADGTPRMTGDGVTDAMGHPSHPVDMSGWSLGPRRAWHLKVSGPAG